MRDDVADLEPISPADRGVQDSVEYIGQSRGTRWFLLAIIALLVVLVFQQYQAQQSLDRSECVTTAYVEQPTNRLQSWRNEVMRRCDLSPVLPASESTEKP